MLYLAVILFILRICFANSHEDSLNETMRALEAISFVEEDIGDRLNNEALRTSASETISGVKEDIGDSLNESVRTSILETTSYAEDVCSDDSLEKLSNRIERIEKVFDVRILNLDRDNMSHLELFLSKVKIGLLRSIPASDPECHFSWKHGSCYPQCLCKFQYKLGDYYLSRSCRLKKDNSSCLVDSTAQNFLLQFLRLFSKLASLIVSGIISRKPSTDECSWNYSSLNCHPKNKCSLQYKLGDFSLGRMCRLKQPNYNEDIETDIADEDDGESNDVDPDEDEIIDDEIDADSDTEEDLLN